MKHPKLKDRYLHLFLSYEKKRILWALDQGTPNIALYHRKNLEDKRINVLDDLAALERLALVTVDHEQPQPLPTLAKDGKRYLERYREWFQARNWNV